MLPWIAALKVFNAGKPSWCIPRKGTVSYETITQIRRGEEVKTPKQIMDELERKTVGKSKTEKRSLRISLDTLEATEPTPPVSKPKRKIIRAKVPVSPKAKKEATPTELRKEKKALLDEKMNLERRLFHVAGDISRGEATAADRTAMTKRTNEIEKRLGEIRKHLEETDPLRAKKEERRELVGQRKKEDAFRATLGSKALKIETKKEKTKEDLKELAALRKQQDVHIANKVALDKRIQALDEEIKKK